MAAFNSTTVSNCRPSEVFDQVEVRASGRPVQHSDAMLRKPLCGCSGGVDGGVVLLKDPLSSSDASPMRKKLQLESVLVVCSGLAPL